MAQRPFPISWKDLFIETAFAKRFQALLRSAWQYRTWHVIVADPGSGKTTAIIDFVRTTGSPSGTLSGRRYPILAVTCPKDDENEQTLGNYLYRALGLQIRGHWTDRKCRLMGLLVEYGVQCLIFDDAHDISIPHLTFIKELTDQGRLPPYNHRLGVCLVTAGRGSVMPLKDTLDQQETLWIQFRHRLDKLQPFCRIVGHTKVEVQEILATLETVYRETLPELNLCQWGDSIYDWLTHRLLDPTGSGRVVMDHLMRLVSNALEWSYEDGLQDVSAERLKSAAELLTLGRNIIRLIDGAGPSTEVPQPPSTEQGNGSKTEPETKPEREAAQADHDPHNTETVVTAGEQVQTVKTSKCMFPGLVSIDLKRFQDSGIQLVECPDCGRTRTLTPLKGVLRFPSHKKRITTTPNIGPRWARIDSVWDAVGG